MISMKIDVVLIIQAGHPDNTFGDMYLFKESNCCLTDSVLEHKVAMLWDIYEAIWFKLGVMLDTTEF